MELLIGKNYGESLKEAVRQANSSIDISMYDWRYYFDEPSQLLQQINIEIVAAIKRGVRMRVTLGSPTQIKELKQYGILAKKSKEGRLLHAKMVWIDQTYLYIGSHNFTKNAMHYNIEASVKIKTEEEAVKQRLDSFFSNLYGI